MVLGFFFVPPPPAGFRSSTMIPSIAQRLLALPGATDIADKVARWHCATDGSRFRSWRCVSRSLRIDVSVRSCHRCLTSEVHRSVWRVFARPELARFSVRDPKTEAVGAMWTSRSHLCQTARRRPAAEGLTRSDDDAHGKSIGLLGPLLGVALVEMVDDEPIAESETGLNFIEYAATGVLEDIIGGPVAPAR